MVDYTNRITPGLPESSEWTKPDRPQQPSFLQRLTSVGRQEIGDLYRKKSSKKVYREPDTHVDIPVSGISGFLPQHNRRMRR